MANINNPDVIIKANVVQGENVIKAYPSLNPTASTEHKGIIRIATDSEALEGIDKGIAITPHTLKQFVDTNALAIDTPYGYTVEMLLDEETYLLTIILKDKNGGVLSSTTADFPIESIIDSGRYDNTTKTIIFELKNGETIEIPIGDLIDGLQAEITVDNKLNSDLVDDSNAVNKFVTAENKATWNSKQDYIDDLTIIRNNAISGKSAYDTISNYGDIVTHNVDEFATSNQGAKADSAVQPSDIGTVARTNSYNDIDNQPQINGVTLSGNKSSKDLGIIYYKEFGTINIEIPQGIE